MGAEFSLVHLSDIHLFEPSALRLRFLFDKRCIGGLNALLRRGRIHRRDAGRRTLEAIAKLRPDHVVFTGDASTLGAEAELEDFRRALTGLPLGPEAVSVVPGNHDAYVPEVVARDIFRKHLGIFQVGDPPFPGSEMPFVRLRGPLAIVGCSTARPVPPFLAVGHLGRSQLHRLDGLLGHPAITDRIRVIVLHHPPQPGAARLDNLLVDAPGFRRLIARRGAELILHGHLHRTLTAEIPGPRAPVAVRGVGSASSVQMELARRAQFRRFVFRGDALVSDEVWVRRFSGNGFERIA